MKCNLNKLRTILKKTGVLNQYFSQTYSKSIFFLDTISHPVVQAGNQSPLSSLLTILFLKLSSKLWTIVLLLIISALNKKLFDFEDNLLL